MNNRTIGVFALGVIIGYGISLLPGKESGVQAPAPETSELSYQKHSVIKPVTETITSEKPPATEIPSPEVADVREPTNEPTEANDSSEVFNLDIAESELVMMEDNLSDLQKDVALIRSEEGWIVRFYAPSNLMESIGVKDQDLIRFSHLEDLKKDPTKTLLVSRIESLFSHLER